MIAIIDYKAGNLASVSDALERLGARYLVTNNKTELDAAQGIIFPGVGHAAAAMHALEEADLIAWLQNCRKPLLGICLGMQLLFDSSEEGGDTPGLGLIAGRLKKFDASKGKVPHMGWNTIQTKGDHPLLAHLNTESWFYHVHSYYAPVVHETIASCTYQVPFSAVVAKGNVMGTQFHPEKSGKDGEQILANFLDIVKNHT